MSRRPPSLRTVWACVECGWRWPGLPGREPPADAVCLNCDGRLSPTKAES